MPVTLTKNERARLMKELLDAEAANLPIDAEEVAARYRVRADYLRTLGMRWGIKVRSVDRIQMRVLREARPELTSAQLAARLELPVESVRRAIRAIRSEGKFVPVRPARLTGGTTDVQQLVLPPEIGNWLTAQIPQGGTLIDALRAIVIDAYHDDQEEKKQ